MTSVTLEDFASSFGTSVNALPANCRELAISKDFSYAVIRDEDRDALILDILKRIDMDTQKIGAEERRSVWEQGWGENLAQFRKTGYDLDALKP